MEPQNHIQFLVTRVALEYKDQLLLEENNLHATQNILKVHTTHK